MSEDNLKNYKIHFDDKKKIFNDFFQVLSNKITYQPSPSKGFRTRIEFGITKFDNYIHYFMNENDTKKPISQMQICHPRINLLMEELIQEIRVNKEIRDKLFQVEFQVSRKGDALISLIYHRHLSSKWIETASILSKKIDCSLVGRSRKQKLVVGKDYVSETYVVSEEDYQLRLFEQCFSQPNPYICDAILEWIFNEIYKSKDVLELHCGIGTFTIPLSNSFDKVLATDNSRNCIKGLKENLRINSSSNVSIARLSGDETLSALSGDRMFYRLRNLDLKSFSLDTVFVDPPRAGLGIYTLEKIKNFSQIIYVSCGFNSLKNDIDHLSSTHKVSSAGLFDQFPFTDHIESTIILNKR